MHDRRLAAFGFVDVRARGQRSVRRDGLARPCQFRDGHGGLHTLIWASAVGQRMLLHTWNGPDGGHDDALDYPFNAAVKALPWARGFPNVQLHD